MGKAKIKLLASDINNAGLPARVNEIPESTVLLFLQQRNEPLTYKTDLEEAAMALSLRYGYPVCKELTPSSPWQRVYCKKVLVTGLRLIKDKEKSEAEE